MGEAGSWAGILMADSSMGLALVMPSKLCLWSGQSLRPFILRF